jgi:hypothetical protein
MHVGGCRILLVATVACFAVSLLAACGSPVASAPHLPKVSTVIKAGPKPGQATISISSKGNGQGVAQMVLTYPDGHREIAGGVALEDGATGTWAPRGLEPGLYECTVYAVTTLPTPGGPWLAKTERTQDNVLTSKTFVVR